MENVDIVIVGGGFVGTCALLGLKQLSSKLKILLIDGKPKTATISDPRSIVLSYASHRILTHWGYWDQISSHCFPLKTVHVSQAGRLGRIKMEASQYGVPALGYVIPANELNAFLNNQTSDCSYLYHTLCIGLEQGEDYTLLTLQQPEGLRRLKAKLVLAADGADSNIRSLSGIPIKERKYNQYAVVTQTKVRHPNQTGYERFIGKEVLACVPCGGDDYGIIWKADALRSQALMTMPPEAFLKSLERALANRLGKCFALSARSRYPLRFVRALQETLPGLVLLGDAAHANPPLAAQGLNLSLRDIATLVDQLVEAVHHQQEFRSAAFLKAYEALRIKDQSTIISLVNLPLTSAFNAIPDTLKGIGFLGMDLCGGLKRWFAESMLGTRF